MKRTLFLTALAVFFFAFSALAASRYIASVDKKPFHTLSCRWAKKIAPAKAVYYNTREEAIKAGHRPCKVCNP